jgi:hypothetical protein
MYPSSNYKQSQISCAFEFLGPRPCILGFSTSKCLPRRILYYGFLSSILLVWIASLFGSTPSNWCLCGSLPRLDQPLVSSVDRRTLWINPLHLWLCGSPNTVDQPLVLSSGSKFPLTHRTIVCLDASGHIVVVSLTKTTVVPTKIPRV